MALYLYQAAYTAESVAAQIKEPHDRIKAVTPALEAMGAKIVAGGYPLGGFGCRRCLWSASACRTCRRIGERVRELGCGVGSGWVRRAPAC